MSGSNRIEWARDNMATLLHPPASHTLRAKVKRRHNQALALPNKTTNGSILILQESRLLY
jgi:hypothetical protein